MPQQKENGSIKLHLKDNKEQVDFDEFANKYVPTLKNGAQFKLSPYLFTGTAADGPQQQTQLAIPNAVITPAATPPNSA